MSDQPDHNKNRSDCTSPLDPLLPARQCGRYSAERDFYAAKEIAEYVDGQARGEESVQNLGRVKFDAGSAFIVPLGPDLMRAWRLTRLSYYLDFAIYPVVIVALVLVSAQLAGLSFGWLQWCVAGFVAWTFVEYWLHRLLFHGTFPAIARMHGVHHVDPAGWVGVPLWYSLGFFLAGGVPIVAMFGWGGGIAAVVGLLLGYLLYICIHDAAHHRSSYLHPWFPQLRLNHLRHHFQDGASGFGVTSDLWDRLFGTKP